MGRMLQVTQPIIPRQFAQVNIWPAWIFSSHVYPPAFRVRVSAGNIKRDNLDNKPRLSRL